MITSPNDYIVYDNYLNKTRIRTKGKEGYIIFHKPLLPTHLKNKRARRYFIWKIIRRFVNTDIPPYLLAVSITPNVEEQYYIVKYISAKRNGIKLRRYNRLSKAEKRKIIEMRLRGTSIYEIARKLGRHVSTVYYFLKRNNLI